MTMIGQYLVILKMMVQSACFLSLRRSSTGTFSKHFLQYGLSSMSA